MLRLRSLRPVIHQYRTHSTALLNKLSLLEKGGSLEDYRSILHHPDLTGSPGVVAELFKRVYNDATLLDAHKAELHNTVLSTLLPFEPGLSNAHVRSLDKLGHRMTVDAIEQVILNNKGRVDSSWEIFSKWILQEQQPPDRSQLQTVLAQVLKKVVYGDHSEQDDGYTMNDEARGRAVWLLKNLIDSDAVVHEILLKESVEAGDWGLVDLLGVDSFGDIARLNPNNEQLLNLWILLKDRNITAGEIVQYGDLLERLVAIMSKHSSDVPAANEVIAKLNSGMPSLSIQTGELPKLNAEELFSKLYPVLDSQGPFTSLRLVTLKCQGIHQMDFTKALELYHQYIACDKSNTDFYMSTMMQIACYHAVRTHSESFLTIGDTLVPQPVPVKCLQAQIISKAAFNADDSLDIFNKHITQVVKGEQSLKLVQSLILAFLSTDQRALAHILRDGAIGNGLVVGDGAQEQLKPLFRRYGEIMGEEEEDGRKELYMQELLLALEKL